MQDYTFLFENKPYVQKTGEITTTKGIYGLLVPSIFNTHPSYFNTTFESHYISNDKEDATKLAQKLMRHKEKFIVVKTTLIDGEEDGDVKFPHEEWQVLSMISDIRMVLD